MYMVLQGSYPCWILVPLTGRFVVSLVKQRVRGRNAVTEDKANSPAVIWCGSENIMQVEVAIRPCVVLMVDPGYRRTGGCELRTCGRQGCIPLTGRHDVNH